MTRVLLTGGSGFLASHVLDVLLKRGHSVVTTVRSEAKADSIKKSYPSYGKEKLDFTIVKDIAAEGAFDEAVKSDPPFAAVIHTASPYTFAVTDVQTQLIDPAVRGTTGILKSIKANAPTVTRVVVTSSFAAIINSAKGAWPEHTYSEKDFNPITLETALEGPRTGYGGSKTFAERAAWDFVENEKPDFSLTTINPPMIYGPVAHEVSSLESLNTSNQRTRDAVQGKWKTELAPTGLYIWIDVRDVALVHVLAMETNEVAGQRVFATAGYYTNRDIVEAVRKHFPEYAQMLPGPDVPGGDYPEGGRDAVFKIDNGRVKKLLGKDFISFEQSVVDLVNSLKPFGL